METEAGALHSLASVGCYGEGKQLRNLDICVQGEDVRKSKSVPRLEMRLDKQAGTRLPGSLCRQAHDAQKESIPEEASGCQAGITGASCKLHASHPPSFSLNLLTASTRRPSLADLRSQQHPLGFYYQPLSPFLG